MSAADEDAAYKADILLVAAAPDLLAACKAALKVLRPTATLDGEEVENVAPAHVLLQDAIRKARQ